VTDDFVAVIDGSTSKTTRRYSLFHSNGRYAMRILSHYLSRAPKDLSCEQFCREATLAVRKVYRKRDLEWLAEHPEERLTASCIVFSRLRREVWMVGDCQCLIGDQYYDNPKPSEQLLAEERAAYIRRSHLPPEHFLANDEARAFIIPHMLQTMQQQNKTYAVIDGFPVAMAKVRIITLDFQPWEIVLASDGYPFLRPTLDESERLLALQREQDPLNIGQFKATKAFMPGSNSFDDRSYVRFRV